ncbi:MAG: acyclic terpene utilization AtuA family protein [Acidimicrobiales bacterium]
MSEPLRIANCSGFYGDRLSAAREMVEGGPIDVLTGDWLAELTMLILARTRARRPGAGYARSFLTQMEQVMGTCLDRGIRVVANAGGLDPDRCAEAVAEIGERLGLAPRVAYVNGDDLLPRLEELRDAGVSLAHLETGEPVGDVSRFVSANAYLGCFGIVDALARGADIVVTGRVTDAAVVCGPAAWHHGWRRDDWDRLAGGVVAGHVIECGAQVTGGNYSFFTEIEHMTHVGFPWVEVAEDGSCVVGKHDGTDGEVSIGTVTSQLLYEIGAPAYLGPDVTARFDTLVLEQLAPDRVRISGAQGEPPPPTLKVAMNEIGGYRQDLTVALTGLDIEAKARLVEDAFWRQCPVPREEFDDVTVRVLRTDKPDPPTNEEAVALWRITLKDRDEAKVGRAVADAAIAIALATVPGFFNLGPAPSSGSPYGVFRPAVVPASLVPQYVTVLGDGTALVDSVAPEGAVSVTPAAEPAAEPPTGPTTRVALGTVVGTRSGDKGGRANLGVFARSDSAWAWLDRFLTVERLRELLPETAPLTIERYRLPALRSLNFVIVDLLQEGVAASTRQDAQAKGLGEWLRARMVDVPTVLVT